MIEYVVLTSRNFTLEDVVRRTGNLDDHVPPRRRYQGGRQESNCLSIVSASPLRVSVHCYDGSVRWDTLHRNCAIRNADAAVERGTPTILNLVTKQAVIARAASVPAEDLQISGISRIDAALFVSPCSASQVFPAALLSSFPPFMNDPSGCNISQVSKSFPASAR